MQLYGFFSSYEAKVFYFYNGLRSQKVNASSTHPTCRHYIQRQTDFSLPSPLHCKSGNLSEETTAYPYSFCPVIGLRYTYDYG